MSVTTSTTAAGAEVVEAAKAFFAADAAKKEAKALKERQRREAKRLAKREAAKNEMAQRSATAGLVVPTNIDQDEVAGTLDDCIRILESQAWGFAFNELTNEHVFRGEVNWPAHYGRVLDDELVLAIQVSLGQVFNTEFSDKQVRDSLKYLCRKNPYNPVTEYLDSLTWDKKQRVGKWLHTYLGAQDDDYTNAVGAVFLVGAVARARTPGCKFDTMMILEGEQGAGKSTALKIMGGEWYSDAELGNLKDKDSAMILQGAWIYEMPELSTMSRTERNTMKAFMTREVDRYRATRANLPGNKPRRFVPAGTVNPEGVGYLTDPTGNRRYLPVMTGKLDLAKLAKDRDQLWAEAAAMFADGYSTVMPSGLWSKAAEVAAERVQEDPWQGLIADWLTVELKRVSPRARVWSHEVLSEACGVDDNRMSQQDANRLGRIMRGLGCTWTKFAVEGSRKPRNGWKLPERKRSPKKKKKKKRA